MSPVLYKKFSKSGNTAAKSTADLSSTHAIPNPETSFKVSVSKPKPYSSLIARINDSAQL